MREAGKPRSREGGGRLTVIQVHTAQGEIDDRRIPFFDKVVLGEPLDMEDEVWRESREVMPLQGRSELLSSIS
jgi:hypothetical protein